MKVNNYIKEIAKDIVDLLGIILFFIYIATGAKYDIIYYASLFFFGLYFYKEKFAFKTIAYIILTPLVMVVVPYYFGEIGKYIMTGVILLVVGIVIMRRNQRDSY